MDLRQEFINQSLIVDLNLESGDHKVCNRAMRSLIKVHKEFEKDKGTATAILNELLFHENDCVRLMAATHCLALNVLLIEAQFVLDEVAKNSSKKVIAFDAQATIEIWRKQGYLRMYRSEIDEKV